MNLTPADLQIFARLGIGPELLERASVERVTDSEAREVYGVTGPGDRRTRWLGHEWNLTNAMPERRIKAKAFVVDSGALEMANNGGALIQNIFTPRASDEEVQVSRKFNAACLTSLRGCDGFCDFVPRILEYLNRHPDAAGNIIPPKCP